MGISQATQPKPWKLDEKILIIIKKIHRNARLEIEKRIRRSKVSKSNNINK